MGGFERVPSRIGEVWVRAEARAWAQRALGAGLTLFQAARGEPSALVLEGRGPVYVVPAQVPPSSQGRATATGSGSEPPPRWVDGWLHCWATATSDSVSPDPSGSSSPASLYVQGGCALPESWPQPCTEAPSSPEETSSRNTCLGPRIWPRSSSGRSARVSGERSIAARPSLPPGS